MLLGVVLAIDKLASDEFAEKILVRHAVSLGEIAESFHRDMPGTAEALNPEQLGFLDCLQEGDVALPELPVFRTRLGRNRGGVWLLAGCY